MFLLFNLLLLQSIESQSFTCPNGLKNGETTIEGPFVKKCTADDSGYHTSIIACLSPMDQKIDLDNYLEEDGKTYHCKNYNNGTIGLQVDNTRKTGCGDRKTGESWISNDKRFQFTCVSDGRIDITGCINEKGELINVGSSTTYNGATQKCVRQPNGNVIMQRSSIPQSSDTGCGQYKIGESYKSADNKFQYTCIGNGIANITACFTETGIDMMVGMQLSIGDALYNCHRVSNGVQLDKTYPGENNPIVTGCGQYKVGESYNSNDNKFQYTCIADGKADITACLTTNKDIINVGSSLSSGGILYKCSRLSNGNTQLEVSAPKPPPPPPSTKKPGCGNYAIGQTFYSNDLKFVYICTGNEKSDISGCVHDDGSVVKVGSKLAVNGIILSCIAKEGGGATVERTNEIIKQVTPQGVCGQYGLGQTYKSNDNKFKMSCMANGQSKITHCIMDNGQEVKVGAMFSFRGNVARCVQLPNGQIQLNKSYEPTRG